MKREGTRLARETWRAAFVMLASVTLASCTTTDPTTFGLAALAPTMLPEETSDFATPSPETASAQPGAIGEFVMDEDDPSLPETVASAPSVRPGSEAEAAQAALTAAQPAQPMQTQAAPATTVVAAAETTTPAPMETASTTHASPEPAAEDTQQTAGQPQPTQFLENPAPQVAAAPAKKRGFLSAFFGARPAEAAPAQPIQALIATQTKTTAEPAKPIVQLASTSQPARPLVASAAAGGENALPGVRPDALFEITRRSGLDDNSDIDLYEGGEPYQVASAAGLARLAPNGLLRQTENVDVACLKPSLVRVLRAVEQHYGRKAVVTSGYRSPDRNRRARGARKSLHMYCAAADVQIEGVTKWQLAEYVRSMPGRGGVGTYCHTNSVHIDVGPERDWNWRCRRRK
ncbi:YcbK family protein [Mesorhizobium sp. CAU 1741]|uniref:YcbK family protein n=1 Tax=Mesorhizobium sp. CAU 1741 TaxID=3140366 RepID=UPI00325C18F0